MAFLNQPACSMKKPDHILTIIVISQFCCTSLWFAGNGVMTDLLQTYDLGLDALGYLTSAVQLGFITGTLSFAFLSIADRFSPSKVFWFSALFGAAFNLGIILEGNSLGTLVFLRFLTGFSLAGIYPVGMKIASDYYRKGLGRSLGFLVGALVLGTAFPHLLKTLTGTGNLHWRLVIVTTSVIAFLGGLLVFFLVPDGPYRRQKSSPDLSTFLKVFKDHRFRGAAYGYFGHMWELYTFWAFIPVILNSYNIMHPGVEFNIPLLSFSIIAVGGLSCVAGGYISQVFGPKRTAATSLLLSGLCCLLSPLLFFQDSEILLVGFLILWGLVVVADSPLFSTLVATNAPAESRGTALTIVNSLGFATTILSIQLVSFLLVEVGPLYVLSLLAIGPALGLLGLYSKKKTNTRG